MTLTSSRLWLPAALLALALAVPATPVRAVGGGGGESQVQTARPAYSEARAAADAGQYRQAVRILSAVVEAEPGNADAWNLLGYSSRKLGRLDAAAKYYQAALRIDPNHRGALEYQGELFIQTGAFDKAKANLQKLDALCGSCGEAADLRAALAAAGQS